MTIYQSNYARRCENSRIDAFSDKNMLRALCLLDEMREVPARSDHRCFSDHLAREDHGQAEQGNKALGLPPPRGLKARDQPQLQKVLCYGKGHRQTVTSA